MSIERERAYVFSCISIPRITKLLNTKIVGNPIEIADNYLSSDMRIRHTGGETCLLTVKTGDKSSGLRTEEEQIIVKQTAKILAQQGELFVCKTRYILACSRKGEFVVTLDIVSSPMQIAILEIESTNGDIPPTASELFDVDLIECPLSAWNFFLQKIGICGAPSSGKTEMAKSLSHLINTKLKSNSFHVLEYATSFIQKYDRRPTSMDQFLLWYSQRAREEDAWNKADIVLSDSPTFLSYIYMLFNNKETMSDQFKIHLTKLYKRVLEDVGSYTHIVYLKPSNLVNNNIRFHTTEEIRDIATRIYSFIQWHNIPHIVAEKTDTQRIFEHLFFINKIEMEKIE